MLFSHNFYELYNEHRFYTTHLIPSLIQVWEYYWQIELDVSKILEHPLNRSHLLLIQLYIPSTPIMHEI